MNFLRKIQAEVKEVAGMDLAESTMSIFAYPELFQTEDVHNCYSEGQGIACSLCEWAIYIQCRYVSFPRWNRDWQTRCNVPVCLQFRGRPAVAQKLLVRGHHLSAITTMSTVGVLDCQIVDCAVWWWHNVWICSKSFTASPDAIWWC